MILNGFGAKEKSAVLWYAYANELIICKAWPPIAHFRTGGDFMDVAKPIDQIMVEYLKFKADTRHLNKKERAMRYLERKKAK